MVQRMRKVNMLLEHPVKPNGQQYMPGEDLEDGSPAPLYGDHRPVLFATREGSELALAIGYNTIWAWAMARGDQVTADAMLELLNNHASHLPMSTDNAPEPMAPFAEVLDYSESLVRPLNMQIESALQHEGGGGSEFSLAERLVSAMAGTGKTDFGFSLLQAWAEGYYEGYQAGERDKQAELDSNLDAALGR